MFSERSGGIGLALNDSFNGGDVHGAEPNRRPGGPYVADLTKQAMPLMKRLFTLIEPLRRNAGFTQRHVQQSIGPLVAPKIP